MICRIGRLTMWPVSVSAGQSQTMHAICAAPAAAAVAAAQSLGGCTWARSTGHSCTSPSSLTTVGSSRPTECRHLATPHSKAHALLCKADKTHEEPSQQMQSLWWRKSPQLNLPRRLSCLAIACCKPEFRSNRMRWAQTEEEGGAGAGAYMPAPSLTKIYSSRTGTAAYPKLNFPQPPQQQVDVSPPQAGRQVQLPHPTAPMRC